MSHPDPFYDPDNSYEDDDMNYDDYNDFYEDEAEVELEMQEDEEWYASHDDYDDSMDGDFDSAMRDAGFGTDEDYGCYGGEDY